jgi:hypothetical protein
MKVLIQRTSSDWRQVKGLALHTINKCTSKEPTSEWKLKILKSQHSPIRALMFDVEFQDLPYFVSVHLSRHKIGVEHFVGTQRTDRTGVNRDMLPQTAKVNHRMIINAEALIQISRKRLCQCASLETREAWQTMLWELKKIEPELYSVCVVECVYRGHCPEYNKCGFADTEAFLSELIEYQKI